MERGLEGRGHPNHHPLLAWYRRIKGREGGE